MEECSNEQQIEDLVVEMAVVVLPSPRVIIVRRDDVHLPRLLVTVDLLTARIDAALKALLLAGELLFGRRVIRWRRR